jgi:hypothetical protein
LEGDWLKDIRSVDTTQIPTGFFELLYREMSAVMRWLFAVFRFSQA